MKCNNSLTPFYYELAFFRSNLFSCFTIGLLYLLLFKISFSIHINSINVCPVFLPAGLALASVLIIGKKALLGIVFGVIIINIFPNLEVVNFNTDIFLQHLAIGLISGFGNITASLTSYF